LNQHTYLIVGGSMTGAAAARAIREVDEEADIAVVSAEPNPPYDRPPLSKQLWTGKKQLADIWRDLPAGVSFYPGRTVASLDLSNHEATDSRGDRYRFDKLLLATGGTPRRLPFGNTKIVYYRTLDSYHRLQALAAEHDRFAVIGGGFIGSEIAAALAMQGKQVTMLFPEDGIGARLYPPALSAYLNDYYREHGVEVLPGETVSGLEGEGTELALLTESGRRIEANGVVAGIGITPNTALAEAAGLEVDDGIVVDGALCTSHPGVYAAGDVARFHDQVLGARRRVEHEDAANSMGAVAGRAMAGEPALYDQTPMYYSDLFDLGYEAVGQLDSRLEIVADWQEPHQKGVVYYLDGQRLRGVLLWNVWDKVDEARRLLAIDEPFTVAGLQGRL
jgi:3-phenylpropionate/trans-cinnamate dioxygenase ferredoxin reductase component